MKWLSKQWSDHKPETAFLVLSVIFGLLFVFLVPPTQAADETTHFYRAFQLSEGHLQSKHIDSGLGDYLPRQIVANTQQMFGDIPSHYERKFNYRQLPHLLKDKINFGDLVPVHFEGSTVYSPAGYLPQIMAIKLADFFWPSTVVMYYLGRIFNLALWISLVYLAMRLWPGNKWAIFALAMIPMSLSQAATLSPDATINSLSLLTISVMFYFAHRQKLINKYEGAALFAMIIILSLCKPVLFVLAPLALILGTRSFGSRKRYFGFVGLLVAVAILFTGLWNIQAKQYAPGIAHYYYNGININQRAQVLQVIHHPINFVKVLGNTFLSSNGDVVYKTYIGRLGWWDVDLPIWMIVAFFSLIILAIVSREQRATRFRPSQRATSGLVFLAAVIVTGLVLYITINAVGAGSIAGLQGRYFIAFTPLLVPVFSGMLEVKDWDKIAARLFPPAYAILLTVSLLVMVNRFV